MSARIIITIVVLSWNCIDMNLIIMYIFEQSASFSTVLIQIVLAFRCSGLSVVLDHF